MKKNEKTKGTLELKLANGRTKKFQNGYQMWKWASQNCPKWKFDDKK